jgi:hypothetical protein
MEKWESVPKKPWQHLIEKTYHVILQNDENEEEPKQKD